MKEISNLISSANCYMSANYNLPTFNHKLLVDISLYITNLMRVKNDFFYIIKIIDGKNIHYF